MYTLQVLFVKRAFRAKEKKFLKILKSESNLWKLKSTNYLESTNPLEQFIWRLFWQFPFIGFFTEQKQITETTPKNVVVWISVHHNKQI
jgi:hypothetical protein